MSGFKAYPYQSRFQLPYSRLYSFEARIEYPLPSENLALTHLRASTPQGFWNHGLLGEILRRLKPETPFLPSTPLSPENETIRLKSEITSPKTLYISLTYFEGLDSAADFLATFEHVLSVTGASEVFLGLEYVPLRDGPQHIFGIEDLLLKLARLKQVTLFPNQELRQILFRSDTGYIHLHNHLFYYYSPFEVVARMNGARLIYLHPKNPLDLAPAKLQTLKFLLETNQLDLAKLSYILDLCRDTIFKVESC